MNFKIFSKIKWFVPAFYLLALFAPLAGHSSDHVQLSTTPRQELTQMSSEKTPVQADLITSQTSIQPGQPFWVGIKLNMAPDWATYWKNPGDSGAATEVKWTLPEGFQVSPLYWPTPQKFDEDGLTGYGYTGEVILLAKITPPSNLPVDKKVSFSTDISWISCNDSCIPGQAHLNMELPVSKEATAINPSLEKEMKEARAKLPLSVSADQTIMKAHAQGSDVVLTFAPTNVISAPVKTAVFYPEEPNFINYQKTEVWQKSSNGYSLTLSKVEGSNTPSHLQGVLVLTDQQSQVKAFQVNVPLDSASDTISTHQEVSGLGIAMLFAFLGGMILNLMPCVLPVIALKIFSFVKIAQQRRLTILKHGAIYSVGVLVSFWILSGALLLLRAYGAGIGWGFQLQEPLFVVSLILILFLLGLSLFGVFELGASLMSLGQQRSTTSPVLGSFFSGVLATLVATPCSGPLLGPALGFALTLGPLSSLLVFSLMGLGMAFPYLIFSAFPNLIRFLPKPGNWMLTFKQIMGFLMMGTVIWLLWVLGAQTSLIALLAVLASLLILSIGAWIFGHWGTPSRKRLVRIIGISIAALSVLGGSSMAIYSTKQLGGASTELVQQNGKDWESFSPEKVKELREQGKSVFVDFTAKWCLICQANKVVLHSSAVEEAFAKANVITMTADWTKNDPQITKELQKFGRSGVPLYVLYPADGKKQPLILPQNLTTNIVTEYLSKLGPDTTVVSK